jgi:hypothetical protein
MLAQLNAAAAAAVLTFGTTTSVALSNTAGLIKADVVRGSGLTISGSALAVDYAAVAPFAHKHNTVGGIDVLNIVSGGTGYTTATISFSGGGGTGAAATATIVGGVITGYVITNQGHDYLSAPTVTVVGDGTSANLTAHVWGSPGFIDPATLTYILSTLLSITSPASPTPVGRVAGARAGHVTITIT